MVNTKLKLYILTYVVKHRKKTGNLDLKISKTKHGRSIMQSKYPVCETKKIKICKRTRSKRMVKQFRS